MGNDDFAMLEQLKRTNKILSAEFLVPIAISLLVVILFETNLLESGGWEGYKPQEFVVQTVMELLTICCIPLALRLFKFRKISSQLLSGQPDVPSKLLIWGSVRIWMLCLPMTVNVLLYYLFGLNVTFGYMGIILFLSLFFINPSLGRCVAETTVESEHGNN